MTSRIPLAMRERQQWIVWKIIERDGKPTKVPFRVDTGKPASSTDAETWATFEAAVERFKAGGYTGVGYVFAADDPFCGVDLDGCRNKETGAVAEWAREIIREFDTYSEMSPSGEGVKLFMQGKWPRSSGSKTSSMEVEKVASKEPGIEVYDHGRYFAVTGQRLQGVSPEIEKRQKQLDAFASKHFPEQRGTDAPRFFDDDAVIDRARKYIDAMPQAVAGQRGHDKCFAVACVLLLGFGLREDQAYQLLAEWSQKSSPPWNERELQHKIQSAAKQSGERNYLRNARQDQWCRINVPKYQEPPRREVRLSTLEAATQVYLDGLKSGETNLIELGIPDLDHAIGGGVEFGEMVILAARTGHGKSAVALQVVHTATRAGLPAVLISEEMSSRMLGKRAIQFASEVPEEHWRTSDVKVREQLDQHFRQRAPCYIAESCGSALRASETIREHIEQKGVRVAVVDYAQLLTSPGKARYDQITNTSIVLRQLASECKVILIVLCQLNRAIESRQKFIPTNADIKDTGQLEQDADVIVHMVWPHRIDTKNHPDEYLFFVTKNRSRAINVSAFRCAFKPARQMFIDERLAKGKVYDADNWEPQGSYAGEEFQNPFDEGNGHEGF